MGAHGLSPERLGPRHRQVVRLVGGEGLSYAQAAERLCLSVRTVQEYAAEARSLGRVPASPKAALFLLHRALDRA